MHTRDDPDPLMATRRPPKVEAPAPTTLARSVDAAGTDARSMLELQRLAGNASVSRLVAREAATATEAEAEEAAGAGVGRSPVLDVVGRGGGEPLSPEIRSEMEGRLGADFGSVRVHRDATASESAKAVDAHAYTVGNDVVFRSDRWDPSSTEGKHTLAHELSHVVQQASGPVAGSPAAGGIRVSSPDDDFEKAADRQADAALAGPAPAPAPSPAPAAGIGAGSRGTAAAAAPGPSAQLAAAGPTEEMEDEDMGAGPGQRGKPGENEEEQEEDNFAGTAQRQANRDAPNRPGVEEEEPEEDEEGGPAAQREAAAPEDELDEDEKLKPA